MRSTKRRGQDLCLPVLFVFCPFTSSLTLHVVGPLPRNVLSPISCILPLQWQYPPYWRQRASVIHGQQCIIQLLFLHSNSLASGRRHRRTSPSITSLCLGRFRKSALDFARCLSSETPGERRCLRSSKDHKIKILTWLPVSMLSWHTWRRNVTSLT